MDRRLKKWEISLLFGVLFALAMSCWLWNEQKALGERVIRLHVIANSDSSRDQAIKLAVRDRILAKAELLYGSEATRSEALEILSRSLPELEEEGRMAAAEWDCDAPVSVRMEECWFPTKEYENFSLPAGEYTALRVVIGEGAGQNWWCVAFPPLCLGAASETMEQAVETGAFNEDQAGLMTEENQGYVLKFKALELLGYLRRLF